MGQPEVKHIHITAETADSTSELASEEVRNNQAFKRDLQEGKFKGWGVVFVAYVDGAYWGSDPDMDKVLTRLTEMGITDNFYVTNVNGKHGN